MYYDKFNNYKIFNRAVVILLPKINFQEPLKTEIAHFLECIRTGNTPLTGPKHGRDVVKVLETVQNSLGAKRQMLAVPEQEIKCS